MSYKETKTYCTSFDIVCVVLGKYVDYLPYLLSRRDQPSKPRFSAVAADGWPDAVYLYTDHYDGVCHLDQIICGKSAHLKSSICSS